MVGRPEVANEEALRRPHDLAVVTRDGVVRQDEVVVGRLAHAHALADPCSLPPGAPRIFVNEFDGTTVEARPSPEKSEEGMAAGPARDAAEPAGPMGFAGGTTAADPSGSTTVLPVREILRLLPVGLLSGSRRA